MKPIEVPVAIWPANLIMAFACLLAIFAILWFGIPRFLTFLRQVSAREPGKPGTSVATLALGLLPYVILFSPALLAAVIFASIITAPPSLVSAEGVTGGGGVFYPRKTIAWHEVIAVDCYMENIQWVNKVRIVTATKKIELSGGGNLLTVRDYIWSHVPENSVHPCNVID